MYAVVAGDRAVGTHDVRAGPVRRRSAGTPRLVLTSRIQTVSAAQLLLGAVRLYLLSITTSEISLNAVKRDKPILTTVAQRGFVTGI